MSNTTNALVFIMMTNVLFFFAQVAITDINPSGDTFYNPQGSILCSYDASGCQNGSYQMTSTNPGSLLPDSAGSVSPTTGNIFTDSITWLKNFLLDSLGLSYLLSFLAGPMSFLGALGLPAAFTFGLSALWYGVTLFLLISWLAGRAD